MRLRLPSARDIILGGTVPPPFSDLLTPLLPFQYRLTEKEQAYHAAIFGASGSGKSKLLQSIFLQHFHKGHGVGLIDPHADLALDILKSLTASGYYKKEDAFDKLVFLDFSNGSFVPFNILNQPYDAHTTALNALEGMVRVWPELDTAPLFQTLFLAAVTTLIANHLPITPYLYQVLTDGEFRQACLMQVTDPLIHQTFTNYYEKLGREQAQAAGSTLRRAFLLSFSPIIRNSLGQPDNWLDFRTLLDSGKSIIISLGGLEDETKRLLGAMLMVAIEQAALSRTDVALRRPFTLLVDEWGSFAAQEKTIATILSQCRKFQLRLYLAAQSLSQVASSRLSGALENCRVLVAFALGRQSAEIQANEIQAKQIGFADPFTIKEEAATHTQHSQYQSITDQFESWNQELMNLPTRCCYVKVQGRPAARITSLRVPEPNVDPEELSEVLAEYKRRYQRSKEVVKPDQVWVGDITYVRLHREFVYLAVLLDVFTRCIRGWYLGRSLSQELTLSALQRALAQRLPEIHHSDQGVQYAATGYVQLLQEAGVRISMAEVGQAWQNGYAERVMRTIKEEEVDLSEYQDYGDAYRQIGQFLEDVYLKKRIHSSLGYLTPVEFENQWLVQQGIGEVLH